MYKILDDVKTCACSVDTIIEIEKIFCPFVHLSACNADMSWLHLENTSYSSLKQKYQSLSWLNRFEVSAFCVDASAQTLAEADDWFSDRF